MSDNVITLPEFVSKLPRFVGNIPAMAKGMKKGMAKPNKPCGLGLEFQRAAQENPNGPAVIYEDRFITYKEFNAWANRIAHHLYDLGVRKGDCVAIFIENRPELLATIIACAKLGAVSGLLNTSQRDKVLTHSFNLVQPKVAVIGDELVEAFEEVRSELDIDSNYVFYFADQDTLKDEGKAPNGYRNLAHEIKSADSSNPDAAKQVRPGDSCFYIYTSGTTGLPKAVDFNHGRWMKAYASFGYGVVKLNPSDRIYVTLPFYHATGLVICWGSAIAAGAGLIIVRKFSASRFWEEIDRYGATAFGYVGELCRYLMEQPPGPHDSSNRVKKIVGNGMRPNVWKEFKNRFGIEEVMELYASSEGNVAFFNFLNLDNTVGFSPVPYAIVKYDKEKDEPVRNSKGFMEKVKKGEAGLLLGKITPLTPFDGYTDPEKTKSSILENVFKPGDSYFNTGDMMRDLGFKHAQFVDRLGDTFRWKGENVSTTEVENVMDQHGKITETVVYGVEIPNTNGRAGMASIRLQEPEDQFDFASLVSFLRSKLPHYAVPVFIRLSEAMDTTGTFKHQKVKLKEQGFDLSQQDNPVYVLLPGSDEYVKLTPEIQKEIKDCKYRF